MPSIYLGQLPGICILFLMFLQTLPFLRTLQMYALRWGARLELSTECHERRWMKWVLGQTYREGFLIEL